MSNCRYCRKPITWKMVAGKWKAQNEDGSRHDCFQKRKRREGWIRQHAGMIKEQRILDREFKDVLARNE